MSVTEKSIRKYLVQHWKTIFPRLVLLQEHPSIFGSYSNKRIGEADLLFKTHHSNPKYYIAEIKWSDVGSTDLWWSMKAIGYAKAHELNTRVRTFPVVILKKEILTNDIKHLFYALGLKYITVEWTQNGYEVEYDLK